MTCSQIRSIKKILNAELLPTVFERGLLICAQTVYSLASRPWCEFFSRSRFACIVWTQMPAVHSDVRRPIWNQGDILLQMRIFFYSHHVSADRTFQECDSSYCNMLLILGSSRGTEPSGKSRIYNLACGRCFCWLTLSLWVCHQCLPSSKARVFELCDKVLLAPSLVKAALYHLSVCVCVCERVNVFWVIA